MASKASDYKYVKDALGKRHRVMVGAENIDLIPVKPTKYSPFTATRSIELYSEGKTFREIAETLSKDTGKYFAEGEVKNWMIKHGDFKVKMKAARECRALFAEDKVITAAEEADEDNVQANRLKVDAYKWLAEVSNPEVYGKKTKLVGDPNAPISFIIDTGIRRDPLPEYEPSKVIEVPTVALPSTTKDES